MNRPNLASERGAVLIQTSVAAMVLLGFGTFVADYGVLWIARHQAQNAADAGAMAGAVARAYEDFDEPPGPSGLAGVTAILVAHANRVWGASGPETVVIPSFGPCPPDVGPPGRCVQVDVHRDGTNGSTALPTFFGPLLGVTTQGVRATATAHVLIPNATNCLRAWAIPDKWMEAAGGPEFNMYGPGGVVLATHDTYSPPTPGGPGTGLTFKTSNTDVTKFGDLGAVVPLTFDEIRLPANEIYRGSIIPLDTGLPGGYTANVALDSCNGQPIEVGDLIAVSAAPSQVDPNDLTRLFNQDPGATWDAATNTIVGSCAPFSCAPPSPVSPRLVAIAVFDVDLFQLHKATNDWGSCLGPCVTVVNIVGFFIADATGTSGYLTSYPGVVPTDAPRLTAESSFLKAVTLVR